MGMDATKTGTTGAAAEPAAALLAGGPGDALEAMLAEQMAAVHEAAGRAMKRAADCADQPQIEALYLRQAARLMHLFVRQAEALDRRRIAAEDRAEQKERKARFLEKEQREEEERLFRLGLGPRPRRRPEPTDAGRNGRRDHGRPRNGAAPP